MAQCYKIKLTILKKPYERPVHFKVDGQRFEAERTLKFNVNSKYVVNVEVKPPTTVEHVSMLGIKLEMDELKQSDEDTSYFRGEMSTTGLTKSIKGSRQSYPVHIQLRGVGEMVAHLQCKFYGEHEIQHACWGNPLNHLEFEVKPSEGGRLDVVMETFR